MKLYHLISLLIFSLSCFGLLMVSSASVVIANRDFGDKWYYAKRQSLWLGLGTIAFLISVRIPLDFLDKNSTVLFLTSIAFLVLVLMPGLGSTRWGASRWINLGILSFQPAEAAKLTLCLYLSSLLKKPHAKFRAFITVLASVCLLVAFEPDLGTSLVLASIGLCIYISTGRKMLSLVIPLVLSTALVTLFILVSPYRRNRVKTFFDFTHDPLGASYQIRQSLLGLGSGGIFGRGLGQSRQKYEFLPETPTDSILSVIGEELGLVGTASLAIAILWLITLGFKTASKTSNPFASSLASGVSSWIGVQSFLNMGSLTALVPLTGVPLPFISYGGSSLVILLFSAGILVNIAKNPKH